MKHTSLIMTLFVLACLTTACTEKKTEEQPSAETNLIEIQPQQFKTAGMELGKAVSMAFSEKLVCKGSVFAPPQAMAKVSSPIAGKISTIGCKVGDFVKAGQTIVTISGNEFMSLQQNFAEAAAEHAKAAADYERVKLLWNEKIGAEKEFLAYKSAYRVALARYRALRTTLQLLHVNPDNIEKGTMFTSFPLTSPISGYVTRTDAALGQYTDGLTNLVELVNTHALNLKIAVFESDIARLSKGQRVKFGLPGATDMNHHATIANIGKTVDADTKTIECIATIDQPGAVQMVNDGFVEAQIITGSKQAQALPLTAVQNEGNKHYVFVVEKQKGDTCFLKKMSVEVGATEGNFIEIKTPLPDKPFVMRGIDTL